MYTPIVFAALIGGIALLGSLVVRWLSNRPLNHTEYEPEEVAAELEEVFVPRHILVLTTTVEYLPMLLERLSAPVTTGFHESQIAALIHRITHQQTYRVRSAVFPVSIGDVASDLDIQWLKAPDERIQMRIEAVAPITEAVEKAVEGLPSTSLG